ncbi:hypothetical protein J6590_100058 [Homalodisca vitripennis]|nr:hypothetical protein J6590_100058 [Homalodisca vitripennis]
MAINTILLDLSVDALKIIEKTALLLTIQEVLSKFIPDLKETNSMSFGGGGFLCTYTAARDSFITVRGFPQGLVSINVEYYREDGDESLLPFEGGGKGGRKRRDGDERGLGERGRERENVKSRGLESQMRFALTSPRSKLFPPVRRGARFDVYLNSSGMPRRYLRSGMD